MSKHLKAFLLFSLILTLFMSNSKSVHAMGYFNYIKDVYVPAIYTDPNINLQKHIKETIATVPLAMIDTLLSIIFPPGLNILSCIKDNVTINPLDYASNAASCFAILAGSLVDSQNPTHIVLAKDSNSNPLTLLPFPTSGITYLVQSFNTLIKVPEAQAQGYGYITGLNFRGVQGAYIKLWTGIRNLTYLLSAIFLIFMGLMIMFRVKISPQAVISIEQAIPKLAVTLLLITFSYAIVGFFIDLTYVLLYLFGIFINSLELPMGQGLISIVNAILGILGIGVIPDLGFFGATWNFSVDPNALIGWGGNTLWLSIWAFVLHFINFFGYIAAFGQMGILGSIIGLIIWIIVLLVIIVNTFKIWWLLVKVYANFIILTVTGPFFILMGLIPGSGIGFGSWLNSLLENLFVFPITTMMFILSIALMFAGSGGRGVGGWVPPQMWWNVDAGIGLVMVGTAILFAIPNVHKLVKSFFAKKPFDFESAVGESLGPVRGIMEAHAAQEAKAAPGYSAIVKMLAGALKCLPPDTLIDTPNGELAIKFLEPGMQVWSLDTSGRRIAVNILKVARRKITSAHRIKHLFLSDGRELRSSSKHPLSNGRPISTLKIGDSCDGSIVTRSKFEKCNFNYIYDILPAGQLGFYWANKILLGSTLEQPSLKKGEEIYYSNFSRI